MTPLHLVQASDSALTASEAISALVLARGNVHIAAERMHVSVEELTAVIASDPTSLDVLQQQIRAITTLRAFDVLMKAFILQEASLPKLEPYEVTKTVNGLLSALSNLTSNTTPATSGDPIANMLKTLPPEMREAVTFLIPNKVTSNN